MLVPHARSTTGRVRAYDGVSPSDTVKALVDDKGTTAAGVTAMRQAVFLAAVHAGLEADFRKSQSLSAGQVRW